MRFLAAATLMVLAAFIPLSAGAATGKTAHDFSFDALDSDTPVNLADFKGKAILVVNTASKCGFTDQYEGLEKLWKAYGDKGLVILGVPSNDFGRQEPGTAKDIAQFCKLNYGVTFPMTAKTPVSGDDAHPFYKWAGEQAGWLKRPKWNFHKYLIAKDGTLARSFMSTTAPDDKDLIKAIEAELAKPLMSSPDH